MIVIPFYRLVDHGILFAQVDAADNTKKKTGQIFSALLPVLDRPRYSTGPMIPPPPVKTNKPKRQGIPKETDANLSRWKTDANLSR